MRQGFMPRVASAVVASAMVTSLLACTSSSDRDSERDEQEGTSTSSAVTVEVSPDEALDVSLPDGIRLRGAPGSFSEAGKLVATPTTKPVPASDPLRTRALAGFDLIYPGTLRRPLTVTFPAPPRPAGRALPVAVHIGDDGQIRYADVRRVGSSFTVRTRDFSFWAPSWLDPAAWLRSLLDGAGRMVTGRTAPPGCTDARIPWTTMTKASSLLHSCLKDNRDGAGVTRAEAFLKSNRDFYLHVSHDDGEDYTWQAGADTLIGAAVRHFSEGGNTVLLAGGQEMSLGWRRPQMDRTVTVTPYMDVETAGLSLVQEVIDLAVPDERGSLAALWAVGTCGGKLPSRMDDSQGWWNVIRCVFVDALPQLDEPGKALAASRSLFETSPAAYSIDGADQLRRMSDKLKLLGKAVKVLQLLQILRSEIVKILDGLDEALRGRQNLTLQLRAGSLTDAQVLDSYIPPHSCASPEFGGWDGPRGIQLDDGQGEQKQPDGEYSFTSILGTRILGWADFDSDGEREVALELMCSGSSIATCCAGQSSLLRFIGVFRPAGSGRLERVGQPLTGSRILPGNEYGPASGAIMEASLDGTTVTTTESILYVDSYTRSELGGLGPGDTFSGEHTLRRDGTWTATSR